MAKTSELTRPRYTGVINYDDTMPAGEIQRGVVIILGASPNAKVSIYSFDGVTRGAGNQVDVLRRCTVSGDRKTLTIIGESARALHEFKLDDIVVEITVDLSQPCPDCGYS